MFFVFRCYLLPLGAMTLYVLNVPKRQCKITTFPQTRKGMEEILLQCIGIGCLFLHELPLMYHELSLIVWGYCIRVWMALAAMSCLRRQVRRRASMAAVILFLLLDEK